MENLPSLKMLGGQLDLLKQLVDDGKGEQADCIAQTIYENYAYARSCSSALEDELIAARNAVVENEERIEKLEQKLKETFRVYNSDFQLFGKFCKALHHVNSLNDVADIPAMLEGIARELDLSRVAIVLDRELCEGMPCPGIPTFYLKGCMRYIDATLKDKANRVYIGPISRMMRPDIFFGDPEIDPNEGGSCFAFGMMDKYNPGKMIGLFSIHDPSITRFHPEMGTDFLEYFCNSVASTLIDVINHQRGEMLRVDVERITRHDLKTPLNAVINLPHVLLSTEKRPDHVEMLKAIQDAGYRMLGLINRSYDIYRMESGNYDLLPTKVDVLPLIKRISLDLLDLIEARNSEMQVFLYGNRAEDGDSFVVDGEELLLFSMLSNLLKNAIEATPDDLPVSVYLSGKDYPLINIHNYGSVPDSVRGTFFEKYSTAGKTGGTGLGTYSASLIARVHGGSIHMESSEEEGTVVSVNFDPKSVPSVDEQPE